MSQAQSFGTAVLPAQATPAQGKGESRGRSGELSLPLTSEAIKLLRSARVQLSLANEATEDVDRFEHAHLAALRVAGAVNDSASRGVKSRKQENVWQKLARIVPTLAMWAVVFEESARIRVRVEAGDMRDLEAGRADFWIAQVEAFFSEIQHMFVTIEVPGLVGRGAAA